MGRENIEDRKKRAIKILSILKREYPEAKTALSHRNPLELLIATILSAQCTDKRVNVVTKSLFQKYRKAEDYVKVPIVKLEEEIRSTGFYKNKAKNIKECCKKLVLEYGGEVPSTMEELVKLPGVGRKTANVILGAVFGKNEGIVVDTHVHRLAMRLKLTEEKSADKIEFDLMKLIPKKDWTLLGNVLISHGRKICDARKPNCGDCVVNPLCPSSLV